MTRSAKAMHVRDAKKRASLASDYAEAAIPKHPPVRNPKLRAWVAKQKCLIGVTFPSNDMCRGFKVHAAHVPNGTSGTGLKGDDLVVPLCAYHHLAEQHGRGQRWFDRAYGLDLVAEAARYEAMFMAEKS